MFQANQYCDRQQQHQADEYLRGFSKSHQAWSISIRILLQNEQLDETISFQIARILKTKLKLDFVSLNQQEVQDVYLSCITIVKKFASTQYRSLRVQLALILINLYIQTFEQWGTNDLLNFIITELQFTSSPANVLIEKFVFDVIDFWPEEIAFEDTIIISESQKQKLTQLIKKQSMGKVLEMLQKLWVQGSTEQQFHILRSYKNWLSFMRKALSKSEVQDYVKICQQCPVVQGALQSLLKEELQEKAIDLLKVLIHLIPKDLAKKLLFPLPPGEENMNQQLESLVLNIFENAFQTFQQCKQALKEELSDEIEAYTKFYTALGKKFIHQVLFHQVINYIDILIKAIRDKFLDTYLVLYTDPQTDEFAELMGNFWEKLFIVLLDFKETNEELFNQYTYSMENYFTQLIRGCVIKGSVGVEYLQYYASENQSRAVKSKDTELEEGQVDQSDSDDEDKLVKDLKAQYEIKQSARKEIKHMFVYLAKTINPNKIIAIVAEIMKIPKVAVIFQIQTEKPKFKALSVEVQDGWALFESALTMMNNILPQIVDGQHETGKQYVIALIEHYLRMICPNNYVIKTTLKTIKYGGAEAISENQDLVRKVFDYVYLFLQSDKRSLQKLSSQAFVKICQGNTNFVLQNIEVFINMLKRLENLYNLLKISFFRDEIQNLIEGVAEAVCKTNEMILEHLVALCKVFVLNLHKLKDEFEQKFQIIPLPTDRTELSLTLKAFKSILLGYDNILLETNKSLFSQIRLNLDDLTTIITKVPQFGDSEEEPQVLQIQSLVVQVYQDLWPMFVFLIENVARIDKYVVEKIVRFTKHTWRCTNRQFTVPLLTMVLRKFIDCYSILPIFSFIYSIEVIATVFYKYEDYRLVLAEAFEMICKLTFSHLPQISSIESSPDLTEDFFGMLSRYAKYTPSLLLRSDALDSILQLTFIGIGVKHNKIAKSVYGWVEILFKFFSCLDEDMEAYFHQDFAQEEIQNLQGKLLPLIPGLMNKLFNELRQGVSNEDVADYLFDCIKSLTCIPNIDYPNLLNQILNQGDFLLLTNEEKEQWVSVMKQNNLLEFIFRDPLSRQTLSQQTEFLELYNKRGIQHALRN